LGPFGMVWDVFGSSMFPYCSLDAGRVSDTVQSAGRQEGAALRLGPPA
jgi:hypothetical protein